MVTTFLETCKCQGIQLRLGQRPKVRGRSGNFCCQENLIVAAQQKNLPLLYLYCNSFFMRDVSGEFGLINAHLFDILPAISSGKVGEFLFVKIASSRRRSRNMELKCLGFSGTGSIGYRKYMAPTFTNRWARGHHQYKNCKQETDQTVLATTEAFTITISWTCRAKKVEGRDKKEIRCHC